LSGVDRGCAIPIIPGREAFSADTPLSSAAAHRWIQGKNPELPSADDLLVPVHYRLGDRDLRLFSTIATIGEAHDVTLEELRLETFFAADAATEEWLGAHSH